MCLPRRRAWRAAHFRAWLSASVPPEVKIRVPLLAFSACMTALRLSSSSARAARPGAWVAEGLPQVSVRARVMASTASGQGRVVAALSR